MKIKLALCDIDKTLLKADSMLLFFWFGIKRKPAIILRVFPVFFYSLLYKLKLMTAEKAKQAFYYGIKYLTEADLFQFYSTILEKYLDESAVAELKEKKQQGYYVLLVSASPYAYVKFFEKRSEVDGVIGTELLTKDGRYVNRIAGRNCKGEEKVKRIYAYLSSRGLTIDYEDSYAYSDSLSDLPMFSLVKQRLLIKRDGFAKRGELTWKS